MGTPNEGVWPGVQELPDYKTNFPMWASQDLNVCLNSAEPEGIDLMKRCLIYDPPKRINARDVLKHPYFANLDKSLFEQDLDENSFV